MSIASAVRIICLFCSISLVSSGTYSILPNHGSESATTAAADNFHRIKRSILSEECLESYKIVGGETARITEAPYQVAIRRIQLPTLAVWRNNIICGGSLIGPRLVLTAAHCFSSSMVNPSWYRVTMGSTFRTRSTSVAQVRHIEQVIVHPHFRLYPEVKFDIALMILDKKIEESEAVKFVELPSKPVEENMTCLITGWGRQDSQIATKPTCMMKATIPVLNLAECRRRSVLSIADGFFCAGYFEGGIDACNGDSGGPLVCNGVQYGIVSFGHGCALKDNPGVYTDVFQHLEWIKRESLNGARPVGWIKLGLFLMTIMVLIRTEALTVV